ncbi:MAG: chemotaxis protein CheW [Acholeplasmatales bacterium]|jgi:purine-binding chemotaxis protein CheW|nr:chemotaxis protein CheW [Acholeplasmatales bacterium]
MIKNKCLTFKIYDSVYAIFINEIYEIITYQNCSKLPHTSSNFEGIINLRGQFIPVINFPNYLDKKCEITRNSLVIVTNLKDMRIGLLVPDVKEVVQLEDFAETPTVKNYLGVGVSENTEIYLLRISDFLDLEEAKNLVEREVLSDETK